MFKMWPESGTILILISSTDFIQDMTILTITISVASHQSPWKYRCYSLEFIFSIQSFFLCLILRHADIREKNIINSHVSSTSLQQLSTFCTLVFLPIAPHLPALQRSLYIWGQTNYSYAHNFPKASKLSGNRSPHLFNNPHFWHDLSLLTPLPSHNAPSLSSS